MSTSSWLPSHIIRDADGKKTGEIWEQGNDFNVHYFWPWVIGIIACLIVAPIVSVILLFCYFGSKFEEEGLGYSILFLTLAILSSIYLLIDLNNHWLVSMIMNLWLEPRTILFWRAVDTVVLISSIMLIPTLFLAPALLEKCVDFPDTEDGLKTAKNYFYFIDAVVIFIGILITLIFF